MSPYPVLRLLSAALLLSASLTAEPAFVKRDDNVLDNFDGLFGIGGVPPDISGGVGISGILEVVNTRAAYFPKAGNEARESFWEISLEGSVSAFPSSLDTFDPRAWYDPVEDRFVIIILDIKNTAPKKSWLHLAVSKNGHPRGMPDPAIPGKRVFDPSEWHRYRYDMTRTTGAYSSSSPGGADYPTLAVDRRSVYVTVNYFDIADAGGNRKFEGGSDESGVFVFDKTPFYAGTGAVADGSAPPANAPFIYFPSSTDGSLQPAMPWQNPENSLLPNDAWFISLDQDAVDTFIDTYYLGHTPGGITTDDDQTAHDDVIVADPMPQPGGVLPLDNLGDRMLSAARLGQTMVGAFVGEGQDSGGNDRPVIRLATMAPLPGETQLRQQQEFGHGNLPALATGPRSFCLAYTRSSAVENPSILMKILRLEASTGMLVTVREDLLLRSATPYDGSGRAGQDFARWGDYAHVSSDPVNRTYWICQQYARGGGLNEWGTRWFNVSASSEGLIEIDEEIHLTTQGNPTPQFGVVLPQGEVGQTVRTIKVAQGQQLYLNIKPVGDAPFGSGSFDRRLEWLRNGEVILNDGTARLPIPSVALSHQGFYQVRFTNDGGELTYSEEIFLDVVVPPVATMNQPRLNLTRLTQGYLEVILDPVLLPEMDTLNYAWTPSTTQPRILGGRVQLLPGVTTPEVAAQVDGAWTCTVSNLAGNTVVSADVVAGPRILGGPVLPPAPMAGLAPVEMSIAATGVVGGGPQTERPDFPGYSSAPWFQDAPPGVSSVVWRKEGVPIPLGGRFTATAGPSSQEHGLRISNPDYEDEGLYDCVVTDIWGAARAVISPPRQLILSPLAPPYLTLVQGQGPEPRTSAAMVYDSHRKKSVLFGGEAFGINPRSTFTTPQHFTSNDTWEWDGKTWVKRNPAHRPPPTSSHGMAYDSVRGRTVLFGGRKDVPPNFTPGTEITTNDVWEWDGNDWTQITPPAPVLARLSPVMCFDSIRGEVLMLGGTSFNPDRQDAPGFHEIRKTLWGWNGSQWTSRGILPNGTAAPTLSSGNAFAFDPRRGVAVLFGLFDDTQYPVWEWNGSAWSRIVPPLPRVAESRFSGPAFYDPVRRQVGLPILSNNLFPNNVNNVASMVWWDGAQFIKGDNLTVDDISGTDLSGSDGQPFGQTQDLGVFDADRRCFVWHDTPQFVNSGPSHTREMHFSGKVKFVHQPLEVCFENSGTIKIRAIAAGFRPINYQWFRNDVLITDNTHYSGSNTATLTLTGTTAADAGTYTLRAINSMNQAISPPILLTPQPGGMAVSVLGHAMILSWTGNGTLETSTSLSGSWTPVIGATSPQAVATDEPKRFYRVPRP